MARLNIGKLLEYKSSNKVLKNCIQEGSNDDLGLTLSVSIAGSNLFSGHLCGNCS